MVFEIREATLEDMAELAEKMRAEDRAEVLSSGSFTAADAVIESVEATTDPRSLFINGELAVMYGVVPGPTNLIGRRVGVPWVLTTDVVTRNPKAFVKASRQILPDLFLDKDILVNYVDDRYTSSVRWLRMLGFWVGEPEPFGSNGEPFRPFVMRREDLYV